MEELKTVLKDAPFVVKIDNASLIIKFINGSFIYFISAEQDEDKLQGNSCELLIIDECAYIVDDIIFTVLPYTNVSRGQVICVSTPRFK
ncbi:MAG: terminase family protein [Bacteroidales bacterium]|nr:terminase family protein [Candidatus Scybalousia scybalohippi]